MIERRSHFFDAYVARMMQRAARRRAGKPFDLNPTLDEPTGYSRRRVDRILGWFAVRLSERMLTAFSPLEVIRLLEDPGPHGSKLAERSRFWTELRQTHFVAMLLASVATAFALGLAWRLQGGMGSLLPFAAAALAGPFFLLLAMGFECLQGRIQLLAFCGLGISGYLFAYGTFVPSLAKLLPWELPLPGLGTALIALTLENILLKPPPGFFPASPSA